MLNPTCAELSMVGPDGGMGVHFVGNPQATGTLGAGGGFGIGVLFGGLLGPGLLQAANSPSKRTPVNRWGKERNVRNMVITLPQYDSTAPGIPSRATDASP